MGRLAFLNTVGLVVGNLICFWRESFMDVDLPALK